MIDIILKHKLEVALVCLSLALSFTDIYTIGYLITIIVFSKYVGFSKLVGSRLAEIMVSLLLFSVNIMIAGLFVSYFGIGRLPTVTLILATITYMIMIIASPSTVGLRVKPIFDKVDALAIVTTLLIPLAALTAAVSMFGVEGGLFNLVNQDGWDNTSHLSLLQAIEKNEGYVYSTSPIMMNGEGLYNNYPQGWHIVNANFINGLTGGAFDAQNHVYKTLAVYLLTIFIWYFITIYFLLRAIFFLIAKSYKGNWFKYWITFVLGHMVILGVLAPSMGHGYINYLSTIPYIIVTIILMHEVYKNNKKQSLLYIISCLILITAIGLIWVLPMIPMLITLTILCVEKYNSRENILVLKKVRISVLLYVILLIAAIVGYILLLKKDVGISQIGLNIWIDGFPSINLTLIFSLLLIAGVRLKLVNRGIAQNILLSFMILITVVWGYLFIKGMDIGYYPSKIIGLFFTVLLILISPVLFKIVMYCVGIDSNLKIVRLTELIVIPVILCGAMVSLSGQPLDMRFLGHSSRSYMYNVTETNVITTYLNRADKKDGDALLILRGNIVNNPNQGMLYNRLSYYNAAAYLAATAPSLKNSDWQKNNCLSGYIYGENGESLTREAIMANLEKCLDTRSGNGLRTYIYRSGEVVGWTGYEKNSSLVTFY